MIGTIDHYFVNKKEANSDINLWDLISCTGGQDVWLNSWSLPANQGDLTCMNDFLQGKIFRCFILWKIEMVNYQNDWTIYYFLYMANIFNISVYYSILAEVIRVIISDYLPINKFQCSRPTVVHSIVLKGGIIKLPLHEK